MNKVYYDTTSLLYQSVKKELNNEDCTFALYIVPPSDTAPYNNLGFDVEFTVLGVAVAIAFDFPIVCDLADIQASLVTAIIKRFMESTANDLKPQLEKQNEAR